MLTKQIIRHYRQFRKGGYRSKGALRNARIQCSWERIDESLVRLVAHPDECWTFDDLCGDVYDEDYNASSVPEYRMKKTGRN